MQNQKTAADSGYWPLFRFNPMLEKEGINPFKLDSKPPKLPLREFTQLETRFKMLERSHPERAKALGDLAQEDVNTRWKIYEHIAQATVADVPAPTQQSRPAPGNPQSTTTESSKEKSDGRK